MLLNLENVFVSYIKLKLALIMQSLTRNSNLTSKFCILGTFYRYFGDYVHVKSNGI